MPTGTALRARIESFTADLANIVRAAALEAVTTALGAPTAPAKRGPGRPVKSGTPSPIVAPTRNGKRAKRTPEDVAKMGEAVVAYVAKHPGVSVEQIKKALGVETKDLQLPIVRMVAAKMLKTTGERRGTRYFVR
ncbi:MAG: hypothetical protein JNN27_09065 [Planctomycetes bacterium]|nr:hypothetical protein [Planctomycetota bacterium]